MGWGPWGAGIMGGGPGSMEGDSWEGVHERIHQGGPWEGVHGWGRFMGGGPWEGVHEGIHQGGP